MEHCPWLTRMWSLVHSYLSFQLPSTSHLNIKAQKFAMKSHRSYKNEMHTWIHRSDMLRLGSCLTHAWRHGLSGHTESWRCVYRRWVCWGLKRSCACNCEWKERGTAVQALHSSSPFFLLKQGLIDEIDVDDVTLVNVLSDCVVVADKMKAKLANEKSYLVYLKYHHFKGYAALNQSFGEAYFSKIDSSSVVRSRFNPFYFATEYLSFWFAVRMSFCYSRHRLSRFVLFSSL
jgi:hypothetical protein